MYLYIYKYVEDNAPSENKQQMITIYTGPFQPLVYCKATTLLTKQYIKVNFTRWSSATV